MRLIEKVLLRVFLGLSGSKKISLSKKYKTRRDGQPVRLTSVSEEGYWPVRGYIGDSDKIHKWTITGHWGGNHNDLVEVEKSGLLDKMMILIKKPKED
jgi:hypothetical protein